MQVGRLLPVLTLVVAACAGGEGAGSGSTTSTAPTATPVASVPAPTGPPPTVPAPTLPTTDLPTTDLPTTAPAGSAPAPPATAPPPSAHAETAILRADGIGPFAFGAGADDVRAWLVAELGEPDAEAVDTGEGGWPLASCAERRFAYWAAAGLTVGFTDLDPAASGADRCADRPRLAGWYLADEGPPWFAPDHGGTSPPPVEVWLTTGDDVGLGATAGALRATEPGVEFGAWDIDEYAPVVFRTPTGMSGRVAWDHVADVQRALDDRGASLAVDGVLGQRTTAALTVFQSAHDITEPGIGPRTLEALGIAVPDTAPIVYLAAGTWDWSS